MESKIQQIEVFENKKITNPIVIEPKQDLRKFLTPEEINHLLSQIPEKKGKDKIMILTMWQTGIRTGEVVAIKKQDINFQKRRMTINWLKNRKIKRRIIPIPQSLTDVLQFYTAPLLGSKLIFPFTRQRVYKICQKHLGCGGHALRHSYAVNFLEQCKDPKALLILRDLLGHAHINTTMEYLKLVPNDLAYAVDNLRFDGR